MAANNDTNILMSKLYPIVSDSLDKNSKKVLNTIGIFFNNRHNEIHAIAPYCNILYNKNEEDKLMNAFGLTREEILPILKETYFWNLNLYPAAAKEPYVECLLCAIKYYIIKGELKNAELVTIYTCFTGKFYASLFSHYWKFTPNKAVMDFVVNNMLSEKFDLKKEGTIFGAIKKLAITWIETYTNKLKDKSISDDICRGLLQQLRDRENSFFKNISSLYYEADKNKDYLNYETDNEAEESYRLTDNDSAKAARITDATMQVMTSQKVSMKRCDKCKDTSNGIRPELIMNVMECILGEKENLPVMRKVINIIICDFLANNPNKHIGGAEFIVYSIRPKPNSKSPMILELKNSITKWLMLYCEKYRKNVKRPATTNAIYRSIISYIVLTISEVALK